MKKYIANERAYSLVELLTVIIVIFVLIAIAIPLYRNVNQRAREAAHDANVRNLTQLGVMWQADNLHKGITFPDYDGWQLYLAEWPEPQLDSGGRDGRGGYMVTVHSDGRIDVIPAARNYNW
jgi:type II secretory pathway pseudopilin PulG